MEERVKEFDNSFTNYLFVLKCAQNGGNYDVKDVMESVMDAYETLYNKIIKQHENGDRQVTYNITGENFVSLEEDLAGLDDAFYREVAGLSGYILCQQTNKGFEQQYYSEFPWKAPRGRELHQENYNYMDEEYRNSAMSMMKQARKKFLELFQSAAYKSGAAKNIISHMITQDADFMAKTQKLFH